ncbi:MAG TPA: ferredoxin family protein [Thermoplasmata archaeon]
MSREVDYEPKPIDPDFLSKPDEYPQTGEHNGHKVFAEGIQKMDLSGKPYPTKQGVHGSHVAVDFEACVADGVCMDVCPVDVFEWQLNPGRKGTGNDKVLDKGGDEYGTWRTDKSEPIRESDCIDCMACESACPTKAIKITPGA